MEIPKYLNLKSAVIRLKSINIGSERNFRRDWKVVIVTGFIIVLIAFTVIWYLNGTLNKSSAEVKAGVRTVLTINRSSMDEIINFYKNQEKLFIETKSVSVEISDPTK